MRSMSKEHSRNYTLTTGLLFMCNFMLDINELSAGDQTDSNLLLHQATSSSIEQSAGNTLPEAPKGNLNDQKRRATNTQLTPSFYDNNTPSTETLIPKELHDGSQGLMPSPCPSQPSQPLPPVQPSLNFNYECLE